MQEKALQDIARWKGISIDRYILYIAIESYTDHDEELMTWNIFHPVCPIVSQSAGPLFSPHSCCQNRLEQNLRGIQDPMPRKHIFAWGATGKTKGWQKVFNISCDFTMIQFVPIKFLPLKS